MSITFIKREITKNYEKLTLSQVAELSTKVHAGLDLLESQGLPRTFTGLDMVDIRKNKTLFIAFKARERLFLVNMAFALKKASYYYKGKDLESATQAAFVGLIRACELYDPTTGYAFTTYADPWIRQGVATLNYKELNPLKIQPNLHYLKNKVKAEALRMQQKNIQVSISSLALALETDEKLIIRAINIPIVVSAQETVHGDDGQLKIDLIADTSSNQEEEEIRVDRFDISKLDPMTQIVYGDLLQKVILESPLTNTEKESVTHALRKLRQASA